MTIEEIRKSYNAELERHQKLYKEELIRILTELGMWEHDVILKSGNVRGRLKIVNPYYYGSVKFDIALVPYKKNGELAQVTRNIGVYSYSEDLPKELQDILEVVEDGDAE